LRDEGAWQNLYEEQESMHKARRRVQRRTAMVLTLCTLGIMGLLGRLGYIQFSAHNMQGHDLIASAVEQRREKFELDSGRGDILDRKGKSLTGSEIRGLVVLPVWQVQPDVQKMNDLALLLHTDTETLTKALSAEQEPFLLRLPAANGEMRVVELSEEQAKQVEALQLNGLYAKMVKVRYDDQTVARHVLGFLGEDPNLVANRWGGEYPLNEKVGKIGLEYVYQDVLRGLGISRTIAYYTDAAKRPVNGLGIRESSGENHALHVKTTLDADIQRSVESAMDRLHLDKGAVIVMDAATEDVLAMASRPNFDPNEPVSDGQYPVNRALKAYFPGSVFKAVIAEAALEKGLVTPSDTFECPGHLEIGDGTLNCWTKHGTISAEQAFAQSCNVAFAEMAMKLGREQIDEYAEKFGLGHQIGLAQGERTPFYGEEAGSVFLKEYSSDRLLANTGIGQEDVRITPLQAAHLMATIANDGEAGTPRLVQSLHTTDGLLYSEIQTAEKKRVLEKASARELKEWLRQVVAAEKGTARILNGANKPVAGKTGTSQTGDPSLHHHWFAGFAPADKPKYVIVVMAESVPESKSRVTEQVALQVVNALP
jgi:cell division protein FtsI/penicillin-binding protein 2